MLSSVFLYAIIIDIKYRRGIILGVASIALPHRLMVKLREKAEEMGYLPTRRVRC